MATASRQFEDLSRRTYRRVYQLALRLVGNSSDAEDLTQEAYFRAFRSFDKYQGERPFENWVLRIVQRLFLDLLRHRRRRVSTVSYDAPLNHDDGDSDLFFEKGDNTLNPEHKLLNTEIGEEMEAALRGLTPSQQKLVVMADIEERTYNDIAAKFGVPVGTIRSRLHRAHRTLRSRLERWEKGNPDHMANMKLCRG